MPLSRFVVRVPSFPEVGRVLLYHTLTGSFVEVDGDTTDEELMADPGLADEDAGFVVSDERLDDQRYQAWYDALCAEHHTVTAIVSVTQACNFACTYCCQADVLDGRTMSAETADATAAWLVARARAVGASRVELAFVGGEPLLQPRRIEQIARAVQAELGASALRFALITNGEFLTRELVLRWKPLGLGAAQVTIDGDEHTHHLTRPTKKGGDAFRTIFDNVLACRDLITIDLNGNFQPDTVHGFPALLDQLRAAGVTEAMGTRFTPALQSLGAPDGSASGACTIGGSRPDLMLALRDEAALRGFSPANLRRIGPCALHRHQAFAVDVDGAVYKCPGFLGKPEFAIGSVRDGLDERYQIVLEAVAKGSPACSSCAHRPDCGGGCVANEWLERGAPSGVSCEREYFDGVGSELIKREYAAQVAAADGVDAFDVVPALRLAHVAPARGEARALQQLVRRETPRAGQMQRVALRVVA